MLTRKDPAEAQRSGFAPGDPGPRPLHLHGFRLAVRIGRGWKRLVLGSGI